MFQIEKETADEQSGREPVSNPRGGENKEKYRTGRKPVSNSSGGKKNTLNMLKF